jgi:YHS domain-containing protein
MFSFLARLILFLIAISLIRAAIGFVLRAWKGLQQPQRPATSAGKSGATMLEQDPVCGTYVPVESSLKRIADGRVVYFCSAECRDRYQA